MLRSYHIEGRRLAEASVCEPGCLVSLVTPSPDEIAALRRMTNLDEAVIADALDPDEPPRLEVEDDCVYVVIRAPWVEGNDAREDFTSPITVVFTREHTVVINPHGCRSMLDFLSGQTRHLHNSRSRILACLFQIIAEHYLHSLRRINTATKLQESNLGDMNDKEQLGLLHMQNCLIYFQAALHGNGLILERILRTRLHLNSAVSLEVEDAARDEEMDIFDDALTNLRQADYTAHIYAEVMDCLLRAHSAVIGARVNTAMKVLTSLTLVLMIPTLVTSAYGMNVPLPLQNMPGAFLLVGSLSVLTSIASVYLLWKKGWFSSKT